MSCVSTKRMPWLSTRPPPGAPIGAVLLRRGGSNAVLQKSMELSIRPIIYYTSSTSATSEFAHFVTLLQTKTQLDETRVRKQLPKAASKSNKCSKKDSTMDLETCAGRLRNSPLGLQRPLLQPKSSSRHGLESRFNQQGQLKTSKDTRTCPTHNAHK